MFSNLNLSNLENLLKRKQKTGRTRECISILRASGGKKFEIFSKFGYACWCRCGFDGFTGLPNVIYIYIYIYMHYIYINYETMGKYK